MTLHGNREDSSRPLRPCWRSVLWAVPVSALLTLASTPCPSAHAHPRVSTLPPCNEAMGSGINIPVTRSFRGTGNMVSNPERGFRMEIDTACDEGGITDSIVETMHRLNLTVAQTYCYLPTTPTLNASAHDAVSTAFEVLRSAGVKALWRFAYDRDADHLGNYTADTVLGHISQLASTMQNNTDALYVLQAGFLGLWGEWHSSMHDISSNASATSAIVEAELFTMLPSDRKLNVRVPAYKLAGVLHRYPSADQGATPTPPTFSCASSASADDRDACPGAFGGITKAQCEALPGGCCFNDTVPNVPFCFLPPQFARPIRRVAPADGADRMAYGILDAASSRSNTALARVGYDNDGFMSTSNDGGTFGPQWRRSAWYIDSNSAKTAPFPATINPVNESLGTPVYSTPNTGPIVDPGYELARRESPWVPVDGEMFWKAGSMVYDPSWPARVTAEQAAWRLRDMHYSTLSLMHGYSGLDNAGPNETIDVWMRTDLDVVQLVRNRLPISPAYASVPHTGYEYVRDHLGYRLELQSATFPRVLPLDCRTTTAAHAASTTTRSSFVFNASVVNWGFAAPINPRPVLLVLLAADNASVVWTSPQSLADVRDWQPFYPGDPTYTPLEHTFGTVVDTVPSTIPGCTKGTPQGCVLPIGLFLPDARMDNLARHADQAQAFSIRFANHEDDVGWVVLPGMGAVNVMGSVTVVPAS
eukprot:m.120027 g.120027  ORF g.120027 m.120027 type:complete len:703 (+) comp11042_c0_seq1:3-2111(+)